MSRSIFQRLRTLTHHLTSGAATVPGDPFVAAFAMSTRCRGRQGNKGLPAVGLRGSPHGPAGRAPQAAAGAVHPVVLQRPGQLESAAVPPFIKVRKRAVRFGFLLQKPIFPGSSSGRFRSRPLPVPAGSGPGQFWFRPVPVHNQCQFRLVPVRNQFQFTAGSSSQPVPVHSRFRFMFCETRWLVRPVRF